MTPRRLAVLAAIPAFLLATDLRAQPTVDGESTPEPVETLASAGARDAAANRALLGPTAFIADEGTVGVEGRALALPIAGMGTITYVPVDGLEIGVGGGYLVGLDAPSHRASAATARLRVFDGDHTAVAVHAIVAKHDSTDRVGYELPTDVIGVGGVVMTTCTSECTVMMSAHAEVTTGGRVIGGASLIFGGRWKVVLEANATWQYEDDLGTSGYGGIRYARRRAAIDAGVIGVAGESVPLPFVGLSFRI